MKTKETQRPGRNGAKPAGKRQPVSARSAAAARTRQKKRVANPKKPSADVVYTQPGPFQKSRFLLHLAAAVAVVLALLFGMSIFFKVETVTVSGVNKYTQWDVRQASGIQEGENLLTLSKARLSSNIRSNLPYVDKVRIGIKLPDTVKIEIVELDVVYAVEEADGDWWLMRADGGIVDQTTAAGAESYTKVLGVQLSEPAVGQQAVANQPVSEETTPEGQPIPATVNAAQQLDTAVSLLQYLEDNGVIGDIASVDVTDVNDLQLWYADRFQIQLGDSTQLSYKIRLMKTAVDEYMESYDSGVLDVSLTIQPDPEKEYQVIYTPFA